VQDTHLLMASCLTEPAEPREVARAGTGDPNPAHQGHHPPVVEHPARSCCCPISSV